MTTVCTTFVGADSQERSPSSSALAIGSCTINPPIALAPMVGLSHSALRTLVVEQGGIGLLYTEMLAARRLPHDNAACSPLLIRGGRERPLFYQIITGDCGQIKAAIAKLHQLDAQGIDLNLGCPAPYLRRQGAGNVLAGRQKELSRILRKIRNNTQLPISVKIRLGKKVGDPQLLENCRLFEDEGVNAITIHARLDGEKFCRRPRWAEVSEVKTRVEIPIFANGGIFSVEDARRCLQQSGADGLMVGRGAVANPLLCRQIASNIYHYAVPEVEVSQEELLARFMDLLELKFPRERRLGRLKQFISYFAYSLDFGHNLATAVQNSSSFPEARNRAQAFFRSRTVYTNKKRRLDDD